MDKQQTESRAGWRVWRQQWGLTLEFALPIVTLVVWLFHTWFAVRDQYEIYYHHCAMC